MNPPIIRLTDVTKTYQMGEVEVHALRSAILDIEKQALVAIMGASGSGKSTLMNIIGCLDRPTSGRYFLGDTEVSKLNRNELELRSRAPWSTGPR